VTADQILTDLLDREAGWRDLVVRPDHSVDPPTNHGITLATLCRYHALLGATAEEVAAIDTDTLRALTTDDARLIYAYMFIALPGFIEANIPFEPLRVQLIDFGVNSGPERAIRWLQRVLGLQATGMLNRQTLQALQLQGWSAMGRPYLALVHDALVGARAYMINQAVAAGTIRKADQQGLVNRALSFYLARPVDGQVPTTPTTSRPA
jgi:hypothetical protein